MPRLAVPLAAVALAVLVGLAAFALVQPAAPKTTAEQAHRLAAGLRCPDCEALSVGESRTAAAAAIRDEIDEQLAAGRTPDEVRQSFVARYGEWILLEPADALAWWLPAIALAAGLVVLGARLLMGRDAPGTQPSGAISESDRRRARDEAEALDA
jgi:cytochrome c-type biogenesis protein CcmH